MHFPLVVGHSLPLDAGDGSSYLILPAMSDNIDSINFGKSRTSEIVLVGAQQLSEAYLLYLSQVSISIITIAKGSCILVIYMTLVIISGIFRLVDKKERRMYELS